MELRVNLAENSYSITIQNGALKNCGDLLSKYNRVLIVTDSKVPKEYSEALSGCAGKKAVVYVMPSGEENKNFDTLTKICSFMLKNSFTRKDCVCAVGGGVVGDTAAFAASIYMRGIDFYNFPTTLLSMVDSSSGGKTGIDLNGVKNAIGTFYQPQSVVIDPTVLKTLDKRQINCGLSEALKMAATFDEQLFDFISNSNFSDEDKTYIIQRSVELKKSIVEQDEKEKNVRKSLNFGHTIGHGIEESANESLLHGECVAIGMVAMSDKKAKQKITKALSRIGLPTSASFDERSVIETIMHDKKSTGDGKVSVVLVEEIGQYKFVDMTKEELLNRLSAVKRSGGRQ